MQMNCTFKNAYDGKTFLFFFFLPQLKRKPKRGAHNVGNRILK